jgi:hypothetical protein
MDLNTTVVDIKDEMDLNSSLSVSGLKPLILTSSEFNLTHEDRRN